MSISSSGAPPYPFKWYFRPDQQKYTDPLPVLQLVTEREPIPSEQIPDLLREIDSRHWQAIRQLLIEMKLRAEAILRADDILANPQLTSAYLGWLNYSDYALANFEGLRSGLIGVENESEPADLR
jgi:hypothetical protein